ncbi:MAG: flagellar motor protein MotB, partial [Mucilaginibacter sp.]|nr:flagellar motor protein MotB [Mucilaginibacter sp.]
SDLKKDSDGDGVSDQFDKCPNTPAGTVVDGSGCPIVMPKLDTMREAGNGASSAIAYSNIQFEFDSSVLKPSSYPVLDATSQDLRNNTKIIEIAGYASSEGTAVHAMRLSRDRANSVKTYLVNSGVDAKRLKIKAYGETRPIADNSTEEGRIANRRVEIIVLSSISNETTLIKFDPGKSTPIRNTDDLNKAVTFLKQNPLSTITLTARCSKAEPFDNAETITNNKYKNLSDKRLRKVVDYLSLNGIDKSRIHQISVGKNRPYHGRDIAPTDQLHNHTVELSTP